MDRDDKIRARAHQLWQAEGKPEGRDRAHWAQAEAEISAAEYQKAPDRASAVGPDAADGPQVSAGSDVAENPYLPTASDNGSAPANGQTATSTARPRR